MSATAEAVSANSGSPAIPVDRSDDLAAQDAENTSITTASVDIPLDQPDQPDPPAASVGAVPSAPFALRPPSQIAPDRIASSSPAGSSPESSSPTALGANPSAPFAFAAPIAANPSAPPIGTNSYPAPAVAQLPYSPSTPALPASPGYGVPVAPPGYPIPIAPGYYAYPAGQASYAVPMPPGYSAMPQGYPTQAIPAYPVQAVPVQFPGYAAPMPTSYPVQAAPFPGYAAPTPTSYTAQPAPGYPIQVPLGYPAQPAPSYAYPPGYTAQPAPGYPTQVSPGYMAQPAPAYAYPSGYMAQPAPGYPVQSVPSNSGSAAPGYAVPSAPVYPAPIAQPITPQPLTPQPATAQRSTPIVNSTALTPPSVRLQGVYTLQGEDSSARARLSAVYPITPRLLFGGTLDLTDGRAFSDSQSEGLSLNELYLATSLSDLPNLRFVLGQLDLTSYFDRNSFAKDGASQFFNPVFQTNPALAAASIGSRPGLLINWSLNDNIEARAAAFSSSRDIGDFSLDGFAGEVGLRFGNAIIRGTYVSARDGGSNSSFQEIYRLDRGNGITGVGSNDRETAYGVNAEIFIPELNAGIFGRFGRYEDTTANVTGDTYSGGISFLDVFSRNDRLGIAYGRNLSNDRLRREQDSRVPDVLELFYDFRVLPNVSLGFTYQELNQFSESIAGVRIRTEFDVTPRGL